MLTILNGTVLRISKGCRDLLLLGSLPLRMHIVVIGVVVETKVCHNKTVIIPEILEVEIRAVVDIRSIVIEQVREVDKDNEVIV